MKKFVAIVVSSALLGWGSTGCEGTLPMPKPEPVQADIMGGSYQAADVLIQRAGRALKPNKPLLAATFVNIDDLNKASSFGRMVSKQVSSRFSEHGVQVVEMQMRNNVFIKQRGGEFLLSRELRSISTEHNAQAVIVGTYAVARRNVYVTARLVRANDSIVLASYDYSLPMDQDVAFMLRNK